MIVVVVRDMENRLGTVNNLPKGYDCAVWRLIERPVVEHFSGFSHGCHSSRWRIFAEVLSRRTSGDLGARVMTTPGTAEPEGGEHDRRGGQEREHCPMEF